MLLFFMEKIERNEKVKKSKFLLLMAVGITAVLGFLGITKVNAQTYYETLVEALESTTCLGASCVIQILDEVEETNTILNGKDVTIDLNGLQITGKTDKAFENNGTLKIIDKNGYTYIKNDGTMDSKADFNSYVNEYIAKNKITDENFFIIPTSYIL